MTTLEKEAFLDGMEHAVFELMNWLVCKGPQEEADKLRPITLEQIRKFQQECLAFYRNSPAASDDQVKQEAAVLEEKMTADWKKEAGDRIIEGCYDAPDILTLALAEAKKCWTKHD